MKKTSASMKLLIQKTAIISAVLAAVVLAGRPGARLGLLGLIPTENQTIDSRFSRRLFRKPVISDQIVTIDIDDRAIDKVGRWPWSWDKLKVIIEVCELYGAKSCAFIDIPFNKESDIYFSEAAAAGVNTRIGNSIASSPDANAVWSVIPAYNRDMISAMEKYGRVFTCGNFAFPEIVLSEDELRQELTARKNDILAERKDNIAAAQRFLIKDVTGAEKLKTAVDIIPSLASINTIARGSGYNRIFLDDDGIARRYSLTARYDGSVYPSVVTLLAADYFNCPLENVRLDAGRSLRFKTDQGPVAVPVDDQGLMTVNWAGAYKETFIHLPYNLVAYHYAFFRAKEILKNYQVGVDDPGMAAEQITAELTNSGLLSRREAESIGQTMMLCWLMDYCYGAGAGYQDFLDATGIEDHPNIRELWQPVSFNTRVMQHLASADSVPSYQAVLSEMNLADTVMLAEGYSQTVFFFQKGMIDQVRPLFFPMPSELKIGLVTKELSLLSLRDKIVMPGLTATGLASQNPNPLENRYMMLGYPANALNTIITRQFLEPVPFWTHPLLLLALVFIVTLTTMRVTARGTMITMLLLVLYPLACWFAFDHGYILPVIEIEFAMLIAWLISLGYKYLEIQRERRKVRDMFSTMVSPEVLKLMEDNPDKFSISGDRLEATMFSSDVSGFTTISEGVTAQELANILNIYLTPMSNIIMKYGGNIDKYEGDAIKAEMGVPIPDPDHAWKCCYSSLEQQEELSVIQRMIQLKFGVRISARMGVNTGVVSAGNMGSEKKRQYSVMGEAVTVAEELEPVNKLFDSWIAIGPFTYEKAKEHIEERLLIQVELHEGKPPIPVYELMGWKTDKFLGYWLGKPVTPLILEGLKTMPPEKVLGYYHYYQWKQLTETAFVQRVKQSFAALAPKAVEHMKNTDILTVAEINAELISLEARFKKEFTDQQCTAAAGHTDVAVLVSQREKANAAWEKQIFAWKGLIRQFFCLLTEHGGSRPPAVIEELLKNADTLDKRVECCYKRCRFTPADDPIALELGTNLQKLIESISGAGFNTGQAQLKLQQLTAELRTGQQSLADYFSANADDCHRMVAEYCAITEKQVNIRNLFNRGRELYLKREFVAAADMFTQVLALEPADGPSRKFIEKLGKLILADLPSTWTGAWSVE